MEFSVECECGEKIEEFTRSSSPDLSTRVMCEACGQVIAVSITAIGKRPV